MMMIASCSDEVEQQILPLDNNEGLIRVSVPTSRSFPTSNSQQEKEAEKEECRITNLWFFAYPQSNSTWEGQPVALQLDTEELSHNYQGFNIRIKYGSYNVYVVGNMPQLNASFSNNEEALRQLIIQYKDGNTVKLPHPLNPEGLPMVYESPTPFIITPENSTTAQLQADLVFTCAKLRLTLLYDNTNENTKNNFGDGTALNVSAIGGRNVAPQAPLLNQVTDLTGLFDVEPLITGKYYDYPTQGNEVSGTGTDTPSIPTKWAYQGVVYLPEHLVTAENQANQTALDIVCQRTNNQQVTHQYNVTLGNNDDDANVYNIKRGTFYDLTARIVGEGKVNLKTTLMQTNWTLQSVVAELTNTELYTSKTNLEVWTLKQDTLLVSSSIPISELVIDCPKKDDNNHTLFNFEFDETPTAEGKYPLYISMNMNFDLSNWSNSELTGTHNTQISIKANNLTKVIDVFYNIEPMLKVVPDEVSINEVKDDWSSYNYTTITTYTTNLGGVEISDITPVGGTPSTHLPTVTIGSYNGSSIITSSANHTDIITIRANGKPVTLETYAFVVTTKQADPRTGNHLSETVTVYIRPYVSGYRIYFRPLNDRVSSTNKWEGLSSWSSISNNSWQNDAWNRPNVYIYTQTQYEAIGGSGGSKYLWRFTNSWPGNAMQVDNNNKGWYYYDLSSDQVGNSLSASTYGYRAPKPAETLIMFNCDQDSPFSRHRYPFHMEPGIPLYNFPDREGWFIYDPLTSNYEFYDDKPKVYETTYQLYYNGSASCTKWWKNYGISSTTGGVFTVEKDTPSEASTSQTGWKKWEFVFHSWEGNMTKDITFQLNNGLSVPFLGSKELNLSISGSTAKMTGYLKKDDWGFYSWNAKSTDPVTRPVEPSLASGYKRIYIHNSNFTDYGGPGKVTHCHYWGGSSSTTWPGVEAKKWGQTPYVYFDIDATSTYFILSNNGNNSAQTGNIPISYCFSSENNKCYYKDGSKTNSLP